MALFGKIDIQPKLVDAQQRNKLVIFGGAGVSVAPPASAPSLDDIVKDICEIHPVGYKPPLDKNGSVVNILVALGQVDRLLPGRFRQYLNSRYANLSDCNDLHKQLVRLFPLSQDLRIITTNYEGLFTVAALEIRGQLPSTYSYPNLNNSHGPSVVTSLEEESLDAKRDASINGIVHIHGAAENGPDSLVVTRSDFRQAYAKEGSVAAAYLRSLPSDYCILTIGFSGRDPIVADYIAANCCHGNCYAMCCNDDVAEWLDLGFDPVPYPTGGNGDRHSCLLDGIKAWADSV